MRKLLTVTSLALGGLVSTLPPAAAQDAWPQWRGPTRDGGCTGPEWPADLSDEHFKESWRIEGLGPSYSGPIVADGRVFTTETVDAQHEVVRALDVETGEELWSTRWEGALKVPFFAAKNGSWIRSTPAVDGKSLYVAGMRDVLVCLNTEDGELRWRVDFCERYESDLPAFGFVSSPLVLEGHVYVQAGASFLKLDARTGETVWRSMIDAGGMNGSAFSSPVVATLAGERQLVVQSRTHLAGIAIDSGAELWSLPIKAFRGMNILTPAIHAGSVFTSTYGGRSQMIEIERTEDGLVAELGWDNRAQGYMTSPVLVDGHAYLFLKSNRFACVDLESGEDRWISPPTGDGYWSLAAQGDRILALSDTGRLRLIRATPEGFEVLSERSLDLANTWAHVAPAGGQVFVRELNTLVSFAWK